MTLQSTAPPMTTDQPNPPGKVNVQTQTHVQNELFREIVVLS